MSGPEHVDRAGERAPGEELVTHPTSGPRRVQSIAATIAELRGEFARPHRAGWDFDGFKVVLDTNAPALITELQGYFEGFRTLEGAALDDAEATRITAIEAVPPNLGAEAMMRIGEYKPSVKGPKEASIDLDDGRVVHKLRTGMWFLFGAEHLAIGPCLANPNQVINFINNRMIQWSLAGGSLLGHASAVALRDPSAAEGAWPRVIAIAAFSGMGKSTLALNLMNDRRLDFLSNDRIMIRPRTAEQRAAGVAPVIEGVPKHPRINPGTILNNAALGPILTQEERQRFSALPIDELWQLEHKFDGCIPQCFPGQRFWLHGELAGVVLLNWRRDGSPTRPQRVDVAERRDLLPALMKAPGAFYLESPGQAPSREQDAYIEALAGVPVLELAGGIDFERGRNAALELLGL
ncbi:HPr kinase [Plesiocystis pacifica SIR-1]|uniref:HPr kinase n=1 Tax=Plesiocystis pacifica SIR-1 TaxID=391625 RepID=A6GK62_9BACT|nr:HprK-related kinase B [Plesiocystis pacifica]EDM73746.1 HPr kinase [Plesiocystis pacifica SIR-1]